MTGFKHLIPYEDMKHHHIAEKMVKILSDKVQTDNVNMFRVSTAYMFCKMASLMRVEIKTHDRGIIPVNMYAVNLAPSGAGKGHSTNILEHGFLRKFKDIYKSAVVPTVAEENLQKLACERANKKGTDPDDEHKKIQAEFLRAGEFLLSFDSATTPAVKQQRHKILLAGIGSMSLEIDEIGSNLMSSTEVLNAYLELYDVGRIKEKLVKNSSDNTRNEQMDGITPANMHLYGTPSKLLDGNKIETEWMSFLETGFGRRCMFSYTAVKGRKESQSAEDIYNTLTNTSVSKDIETICTHLGTLADVAFHGVRLVMDKVTALTLIEYKCHCEDRADTLNEFQEIRKAEMSHRYFKALKAAGGYAFADRSATLTQEHLFAGIKLAEESGKAFENMINQDKNYVRLAKYLAAVDHEVTQADISDDLPFFKGSQAQRNDMLNLAIGWAYKQAIVIRKSYVDSIEFLSGQELEETNLNEIIISHSPDLAKGYNPEKAPFSQLQQGLLSKPNYNWCNHAFKGGNRQEESAIPGFNCVVLDIDDSACTVQLAKEVLKDYTYILHTTKRHTKQAHRFRILLPTSHILHMESEEYTKFMRNIEEWLPITLDDSTFQRNRKWLTNDKAGFVTNYGKLLDVMMFIPTTNKSAEVKKQIQEYGNLDSLERWFMSNTGDGNRSNQLIKYGYLLIDAGFEYVTIEEKVKQLNSRLSSSLSETELYATILKSVGKRLATRNN